MANMATTTTNDLIRQMLEELCSIGIFSTDEVLDAVLSAPNLSVSQNPKTDAQRILLLRPEQLGRIRQLIIDSKILDSPELFREFLDSPKFGQFVTPKALTRIMVAMIVPQASERLCDPACGSGGLLVEASNYLRRQSANSTVGTEPKLFGFDINRVMVSIAEKNLTINNTRPFAINHYDALSRNMVKDEFDVILMDPPMGGKIDLLSLDPLLKEICDTKRLELLFLALALRMLKPGGRAAVVVPDNVLTASTSAHRQIRQSLVEDNRLFAIVYLPVGLFPGTMVQANVLFFEKRGYTDDVFLYSLRKATLKTHNHETTGRFDDPEWHELLEKWAQWKNRQGDFSDRSQSAFYVTRKDVAEKEYGLSFDTYRIKENKAVPTEQPEAILEGLREMEAQITDNYRKLEYFFRSQLSQ